MIVYASRHGCSDKVATMLLQGLGDEATLVNLEEDTKLDLSPCDTVILGGPIYYGRMDGRVRRFYRQHMETLLQKRVGLFICCLESGERAGEELHEAFPRELLAHATTSSIFGGEIEFERLTFAERFIARSVAMVEHNISSLSDERIARFLGQLEAG